MITRRERAAVAVACLVGASLLAWIERSPGWLTLAVPALALVHPRAERVVTAWAIFLVIVALSDHILRFLGTDTLGTRARRVAAVAIWVANPDVRLVADACPRFRLRPGDTTDGGPPRDARGRRVLVHPGPEPLTIWVVGDSVAHPDVADLLVEAFAVADRAVRVIDAAVYNYDTRDYLCLAREAAEEQPDLAVVALSMNDLGFPDPVPLDLGYGRRRYSWVSYVEEEPALTADPPLLLSSRFPWARARRADLEARWPGILAWDLQDPGLLAPWAAPERTTDPAVAERVAGVVEALPGAVVVAIVFPLQVDGPTSPQDPLVDAALRRLVPTGARVVDPRPAWASLAAADRVELGSGRPRRLAPRRGETRPAARGSSGPGARARRRPRGLGGHGRTVARRGADGARPACGRGVAVCAPRVRTGRAPGGGRGARRRGVVSGGARVRPVNRA